MLSFIPNFTFRQQAESSRLEREVFIVIVSLIDLSSERREEHISPNRDRRVLIKDRQTSRQTIKTSQKLKLIICSVVRIKFF